MDFDGGMREEKGRESEGEVEEGCEVEVVTAMGVGDERLVGHK
jgi:hypothetical protein